MVPRRSQLTLLFSALFTLSLVLAPLISAQNDSNGSQQGSGGLRVVTLPTSKGDVKVTLPDDIRAGDTISGTVTAEPNGKDEKERKDNYEYLRGCTIKFEKQSTKVSEETLHITVPEHLQNAELTLLDEEKAKQLARALMALGRLTALGASDRFSYPDVAQSGLPFPINGPFDGDSTNTTVKIRDADGKIIAESPRVVIVSVPWNIVGPTNIVVQDNGAGTSGNFRALKIDLTAPKTSLLKGESTGLHVQVQGLEGISQPVQIQIQNLTPSTINLGGGNTQNIVIQPSQVTTGGTYNWSTNITGLGTGAFNISGTVPATTPTTGGTTTPTASPQPSPSVSPATGQSTQNPNTVLIAGTASEIKKKCDDLQRQLDDAQRRCAEKRKECAELELELTAAQDKADRAKADYEQKKKERDELLLKSIRKAALERRPPLDWEFSLAKPADGDGWESVTVEGVVIWFAYPKEKNGKRQKMTAEEAKQNARVIQGLFIDPEVRKKLREAAKALEDADTKNREAQAALALARAAAEKCKSELERVCAEVAELQRQLKECREQEEEAKQREKEANKPPPKPAGTDTSQPVQPKPAPKPAEVPTPNPAEELNKKLCEFCIKFLTPEGSPVTPEATDKLRDLAESLGILNDALENSKGPSSLLPVLQKLSAALQAANAGADLINQVNDITKQIKDLGAGGSNPANMGKFLKLIGGALQNVKVGGPIVQGLAFFFNQLGDLFTAVADLGDALATFRQMHQINSELRKFSCPQLLGKLMSANDKARGDMDQALNNFIDFQFGALVGNDDRLRAKVKEVILAKLRLCCLQKILKDCPTKK